VGDALLQDLWFHQVEGVEIKSIVPDRELVVVRARASAEQAVCPACGTASARVHSRYVRRLADIAVGCHGGSSPGRSTRPGRLWHRRYGPVAFPRGDGLHLCQRARATVMGTSGQLARISDRAASSPGSTES